jgi:hypothetical protein
MVTFTIGGILFGTLLGMYFRALVLAPGILIAVAAVTAVGIGNGEGPRVLALIVIGVAASLQAGYIAGSILRAMVSSPHISKAVPTSGFSKSV